MLAVRPSCSYRSGKLCRVIHRYGAFLSRTQLQFSFFEVEFRVKVGYGVSYDCFKVIYMYNPHSLVMPSILSRTVACCVRLSSLGCVDSSCLWLGLAWPNIWMTSNTIMSIHCFYQADRLFCILYHNTSLIRHWPYSWECLTSKAHLSTFLAISPDQIGVKFGWLDKKNWKMLSLWRFAAMGKS